MEEIKSSINCYLAALDTADIHEPTSSDAKGVRLEEKIAKLKVQMKELQPIKIRFNDSPDKQVSLTDPDAPSMMTRGTEIVGYNVQTAGDTQHHLIVAYEVPNVGSDLASSASLKPPLPYLLRATTLLTTVSAAIRQFNITFLHTLGR